ncbi:hypothetical protein [Bradyrhizobium mercantei]|uniref:hypothetical protein n=1 Tax=Bradyrhizobium mercantei TaxID=1904807 RepID=UPI00117799C0|nr:hypothetical protein [Bradyrhizobium mercantei]
MQNRYVGDVGDFAKYALLRAIARETKLRIAVIWYLYSDEDHNADGRHLGYLRDGALAQLDPSLHAALARLIHKGKRSVRSVAAAGILPPDTSFFANSVSDRRGDKRLSRTQRALFRAAWLKKALASAEGHQLVFLDPDNGLETASVQRHSPKSGKYVFWNEVAEFWSAGHSLVIYHHLNRTATVARQADVLKAKFRERFPDAPLLRYFLARRGSCRHFWIVAQEEHAPALAQSIERISQTSLRECLELG